MLYTEGWPSHAIPLIEKILNTKISMMNDSSGTLKPNIELVHGDKIFIHLCNELEKIGIMLAGLSADIVTRR
eukprot:Pgem_evm1s13207